MVHYTSPKYKNYKVKNYENNFTLEELLEFNKMIADIIKRKVFNLSFVY